MIIVDLAPVTPIVRTVKTKAPKAKWFLPCTSIAPDDTIILEPDKKLGRVFILDYNLDHTRTVYVCNPYNDKPKFKFVIRENGSD